MAWFLRTVAAVGIAAGLLSITGCGDSGSSSAGGGEAAYVRAPVAGEMAAAVEDILKPAPWAGQHDGTLVLQGAAVHALTGTEQADLRALAANGYGVVLVDARQAEIAALHALLGTAVPMTIPPNAPGQHFAVYVVGQSRFGARAGSVFSFPHPTAAEPESNKHERVGGVFTHVLGQLTRERESDPASPQPLTAGVVSLSPSNLPLSVTQSYAMPADWATCGLMTRTCTDNVQVFADAWMVYSAANAQIPGQPTDFFIMTTSANINTAGCHDFYGNRKHADRIAAYWLRRFATSAVVPNVSFQDMSIASGPPSQGGYSPQQANPSEQVTTGTTWSLGGNGTAGSQNSIGFTAGVQFTNQTTVTYQALETNDEIGATANTASWFYDSWNFVNNTIRPGNHACGGPGLNVKAALPGIVYGDTFNPSQTWVWQAQPAVRQQFNGGPLPVEVDNSLLLGWTFYTTTEYCFPADGSANPYELEHVCSFIVGSGESAGLNFDVACGTVTNFGTIPLGPPGPNGQDNNDGNPGTPYAFPTLLVNVPFAPIPTAAALTSLSPAMGPAGTVVTLTGSNLDGALAISFGGVSISDFATISPTQLQVVAPDGLSGSALVSVQNAAGFSNTLAFTYE